MIGPRYWLVLGALLWTAARAQPPGQAPGQAPGTTAAPPAGRAQTAAPPAPQSSAPDEEFIEFLGGDDNDWEDFLKRVQQPETQKPPPPPPGAKQP